MNTKPSERPFVPMVIRLESLGGNCTQSIASMPELIALIEEHRPTALEIPHLAESSSGQKAVLAADWLWRMRIEFALQRCGHVIADSYLKPRLDQFGLRVECRASGDHDPAT